MKKHVCYIGAHPDDLIGGAGLMFRLQAQGDFEVHLLDFTRGERGLAHRGVSPEETGRIRTEEERRACALLGIEPEFLGEINGTAFANREVCEKLAARFAELQPTAIITHWPVDTHVDHIMTYAAALKSLEMAHCRADVLFFEESVQARNMPISWYVGFAESIMQKKLELVRCYACQNDNDEIAQRKLCEARYHGWKADMPYAEPFGATQTFSGKRKMPEIFGILDQIAAQ